MIPVGPLTLEGTGGSLFFEQAFRTIPRQRRIPSPPCLFRLFFSPTVRHPRPPWRLASNHSCYRRQPSFPTLTSPLLSTGRAPVLPSPAPPNAPSVVVVEEMAAFSTGRPFCDRTPSRKETRWRPTAAAPGLPMVRGQRHSFLEFLFRLLHALFDQIFSNGSTFRSTFSPI